MARHRYPFLILQAGDRTVKKTTGEQLRRTNPFVDDSSEEEPEPPATTTAHSTMPEATIHPTPTSVKKKNTASKEAPGHRARSKSQNIGEDNKAAESEKKKGPIAKQTEVFHVSIPNWYYPKCEF